MSANKASDIRFLTDDSSLDMYFLDPMAISSEISCLVFDVSR